MGGRRHRRPRGRPDPRGPRALRRRPRHDRAAARVTRPQTPLPGGPPLAAPGAAGPVPAGPAAPEPAGPATVRRHNRGLVLGAVADAAASRAAIAARTGLTRGTVSSLVDDLLADGMLVELEAPRGGRGRPANPLQLNPSGPGGVGLEIGVDDVAACVADLTGAVRVARRVPSDHRHRDPAHGLARAAGLVAEVVAESGLTIAEVRVALPGVVTPAGVLQRAPNLPRWQDVGVAELLRAALHRDVPVTAANEADLAALAELWSGRGLRDMLFVSGGVGVGAGVLLDGRLFRGAGGRAGELGHVVVDPAGRSCTCGGRGAWRPSPAWPRCCGPQTCPMWTPSCAVRDRRSTSRDRRWASRWPARSTCSTCPPSCSAGSTRGSATRWWSGSPRRCGRACWSARPCGC
ncbi:ROK family protein [Pseudonocardia benzenivorans]